MRRDLKITLDIQVFSKFGRIQGEKKFDHRHTPRIPKKKIYLRDTQRVQNIGIIVAFRVALTTIVAFKGEEMKEKNQEDSSRLFAFLLCIGGVVGIGFGIFTALTSSKQELIQIVIPVILAVFGQVTHTGIRLWQKQSTQPEMSRKYLDSANNYN